MIAADLLRHHLFPDFELLGGSGGLNRALTSVSVIDAPDVDRWMRGGELLVGSGYIFREDPGAFVDFLTRVNERNVAAVGIKLDRYHHQLPPGMVNLADQLALPLLSIPMHYRWTDIIEGVQTFILQERHRASCSLDEVGSFLEEGLDIKRILSTFASRLQRTLTVQCSQLGICNNFLPDGSVEDSEEAMRFIKTPVVQERGLPKRGQVLVNLELRNSGTLQWSASYRFLSDTPLTVHLWLSEGETVPSARQDRMVLRAMTLVRASALELAAISNRSAMKKERFFEALCLDIYNDPSIVEANMRELGIVLPKRGCVVMVSSADGSSPRWTPQNSVMSYRLADMWTGLVPVGDLEQMKREWDQKGQDLRVYVAVGGPVRNMEDVTRSYHEAKRTFTWLREFGLEPGAYAHDDLSLYALLDNLFRLPEAKGVYQRFFEPLLEDGPSSSRRSMPLKDLVRSLVSSDFNAKQCAKGLHLHYNTVRNHLDDLEEILQVDLSNPHHRLGLTLAFHIGNSYQKRGIKP
ncbi:transcriptional regulator, CdaR [Thermanaerovibrio acidaminovorans DSM 6589]|uniref:Transcriptional regulator, CdaR n=1 Tax=Thermanaerovibrio acidaminovorans (strain ATCC 49978 / DSM 6589 / Su883) TaxID=525903 RepID=D1B8P1_THEAS|nr:PucR family transcriptional regulator ligand-binding domain-containing protein [Thermanaerovibrio acidaminovorans]ACZ18644.1 transcriptional regulator, CdaR [Thermanaerovibrio acidaminovorans DSM 6589]